MIRTGYGQNNKIVIIEEREGVSIGYRPNSLSCSSVRSSSSKSFLMSS